MSLKIEFIEQASQPGAKLAPLCRRFGISRQTGHKWLKRFKERGFDGLEDESRRPKSTPLASAEDLVAAVLEQRDAHPTWGPKKLHELLRRRLGADAPSRSTVARLLRRFGRIRERRARQPLSFVNKAPTVQAKKPNEVWTVDFKGWWRCADGSRCEPLTIRDAHSRFVLMVVLVRPTYQEVKPLFEALFRKYGVPEAIQCDNGPPFICVRSRAGLSRLSAWWVSLGIRIVRSRPACPQDNGAHERMHRDIATEIERKPAASIAEQQRAIDRWRQEFNNVRPHEALDGKTPSELYKRSDRRYGVVVPPAYASHLVVRRVSRNGGVSIEGDQYFVSESLAEHEVGLEQLTDLRWRVWFHQLDCGQLDVIPSRVFKHSAVESRPRLRRAS